METPAKYGTSQKPEVNPYLFCSKPLRSFLLISKNIPLASQAPTFWAHCLWALVFTLFASSPLQGIEISCDLTPLQVNKQTRRILVDGLNSNLETARDFATNPLSQPLQPGIPANLGYQDAALWLFLPLHSTCHSPQDLILEVGSVGLDTLEFWSVGDQGTTHLAAGDHLDHSNWPIDTPRPAFPITIGANGSVDLYLKIKSNQAQVLPLTLYRPQQFWANQQSYLIFQSLILGICGVMFCYNLALWFTLKDPSYLHFFFATFAFTGFILSSNGFGHQYLWPQFAMFADWSERGFAFLSVLGAILFTRTFLELKLHQPKSNRFLPQISAGILFILLLSMLLPSHLAGVVFYLYLSFLIFALSLITLKALTQKIPEAKFCLAGLSFHAPGALWFCLKPIIGLPSILVLDQMVYWGAVLNLTFLSVGLANRVNQIRQERVSAQIQMLKSNRKAMEAIKKTDEIQDQFLSNTSFGLLNPVHQIISLTQLGVSKSKQGEDPSSQLQTSLQIAQRLRFMVHDLLDFSQWKRGGLYTQTQSLGVFQSVESVFSSFERISNSKNVALINNVPKDLPPIEGDWNRVNQCLFKLVDNGLNHTKTGSVSVYARTTNEGIEIEVSDTGPGIPKDQLDKLVQPFQRGSESPEVGLGLGLSLVSRLTELQGGRFWITSAPEKGTSAFLCFQRASSQLNSYGEEPLDNKNKPTRPWLRADAQQPKILIIDSDPIDQDLINHILMREGYQTVLASSGEEALEVLEEEPTISLILLEGLLPEVKGQRVEKTIKATQGKSGLPILQLSNYAQTHTLHWKLAPEFDEVIHKPVNESELVARVGVQLRAQQSNPAEEESSPTKVSPKQLLRLTAKIMNLSLTLWEAKTGKDKLALAEESGLWTISPESSGVYRTRTLDRYLKASNLPKNPRFRNVLQTGYFVRDHLEQNDKQVKKLEDLLVEMEAHFTHT